jgi:hypothetical protein
MQSRKKRTLDDLIESALAGARDNANFPVRSTIDTDIVLPDGGDRRVVPAEERDALSTVPGERRRI